METRQVKQIQVCLTYLVGKMRKSWPTAPDGVPDGRYGDETVQHVTLFQRRAFSATWKEWDGIVGAKTIRAMDEALPKAVAPPPIPPPAPKPSVLDRGYALLPRAATRVASAIQTLDWATIAIAHDDTNDFNKSCLALVDRCFKVRSHFLKSSWSNDIGFVRRVYQKEAEFIAEATREHAYLIEISKSAATDHNAGGYVHGLGGWADKNKTDAVFLVTENCERRSDDWLLDALMHEFAHYCGPKGDHNTGVGHQGPGNGYGDRALKLENPQTLHNASNYAWFAGLSQAPKANWENGSYDS